MNSKELLTILINANLGDKKSKKLISSQYGVIVKQLLNDSEVLEILKKYISVDIEYNQYWLKIYNIGGIAISEEEYNKIKEWLENGKTN